MLDRFGLNRVVEPKGTVAVTAWKLDNRREIAPEEARIAVERIHIERDSFQQISSECGFEKSKVMARIIEIVDRRGKLHNPFTNSGGLVYGHIEEMGEVFSAHRTLSEGDAVIGAVTSAGIPLYIEEIYDVDFNYGHVTVKGYAILFEASPILPRPENVALSYTMAALDEASTFNTINEVARKDMQVMIIGRDLITTMIYAGSLKDSLEYQVHIIGVMDTECLGMIAEEDARKALSCYVDQLIITDVTKPIDAYNKIYQCTGRLVDITINTEDLTGSETLTVLMTVPKGSIFFTSLQNGYGTAVLVAETMEKELTAYSLDQYAEGYFQQTLSRLEKMKPQLEHVNDLYEKIEEGGRFTDKKIKDTNMKRASKVDDFVFQSPVTKAMIDEVVNISGYDCNVIIQGETGVGKEKILEVIHRNSTRKNYPCVKINCATIQENLAESEFFGYEAGAFTGAQASGKKGYFELANNGILFLDEIGQLSLNMQSKLLRVLQEDQFYRVGGTNQLSVNVRVICANNISLKKLVEDGKFREDLYYRLNICTIEVPPLRERRDDVYVLAETFLRTYEKRYGVKKEFAPEALSQMYHYHWPGNVRQLENAVHRMLISSRTNIITEEDADGVLGEDLYDQVVFDIRRIVRKEEGMSFGKIIEAQEKRLIAYALQKEGTTRKAAAFLGMTQAQLSRKKLKYEL